MASNYISLQTSDDGVTAVVGTVAISNYPATQNVAVTSSVLPTGAATDAELSAIQGSIMDAEISNNEKLDLIDAKLGEINTKLTAPISVNFSTNENKNYYAEILNVASGSYTNVLSFTVTVNSKLKAIQSSGTNIAEYEVVLNGSVLDKQRTNFGTTLNCFFSFQNGVTLVSGDSVIVRAKHERPSLSNFNAKIIIEEIV